MSIDELKNKILENQQFLDDLNADLARKTQEIHIIQKLSAEITSSLDLDVILGNMLASLDRTFDFHHSMILLLDESVSQLYVAASHGYTDNGIGAVIKIGQGIIGVVAKRQKIMRMGNIGTQVAYMNAVKTQMSVHGSEDDNVKLPGLPNLQSQVAIPMLNNDHLIGVLAIESDKPNVFDQKDEQIISILANQAASAIEKARVHQDIIHLNEHLEEKVRERTKEVVEQKEVAERERSRSDELLLNILPHEVAEELKKSGNAEAQFIDSVTVLFTDFKDFTKLSEKLSPKELVTELHECFSIFDQIMERYGIEKIKTIGDAYMAAGGLPRPNSTHASDVLKAASEIQSFMNARRLKKIENAELFFEIRIGVHTGPVVAGIVGVKKFAYDIWGDTVNTASRMESSGEIGKINISQSTYNLLKDDPELTFENRGKIQVKGKGDIAMYFAERVSKNPSIH
jgi:class 3 adenylate cyclase/putative methionine-R-sulfoxide reductase with GAF domain